MWRVSRMKRAVQNQKSLIVEILSASFDDNKSVNFVVKQDENRKERIRGLMEYSFKVCNAFGDVWISEDEQACALVLFPDKKKTNLNAILWDITLALSVIGINRIGPVLGRESKIKSFHPKESFSYLWFIGVKPELQSKGKGSQLLREIIEESKQRKRPIYLETSVERNLPWYQNHGFEIFNTIDLTYELYMLRRLNN
jgi:ribosomal protein S18 acetylase RimI-like enzyme